jgi:hypothetical protein
LIFRFQVTSEQARQEIFQVTTPGLPFMVRTRGFVKHMLDAGVTERMVEIQQTGTHPFRLG